MKDFEIKSADELKAMSSDELQVYYTAKLKSETEGLELRLKALEEK